MNTPNMAITLYGKRLESIPITLGKSIVGIGGGYG
jgi:hypothetical protein